MKTKTDIPYPVMLNNKGRGFIMKFTKMQGLGNDYVYINCFEEKVENPSELSVRISDRHFGIGSDGLVLIRPCDSADFEMKMYNADGSEAEMCGNASRCIGKYVYERGLTRKKDITLKTGAGIRRLTIRDENGRAASVRVDMGIPEIGSLGETIIAGGNPYTINRVSMGNPHAVIFVDDAEQYDVHTIGKLIENHPLFPNRTNTEFATITDRHTIRMRVWERGSGETLACGTGACATLVAAAANGLTDQKAVLKLNGGDLLIEWKDGIVYQEGPAEFVFDGILYE